MRITMMATYDLIQFNLTPESEHEKKFLSGLDEYKGDVSLHQGVNISACNAGYLRDFGLSDKTIAITISRSIAKEKN